MRGTSTSAGSSSLADIHEKKRIHFCYLHPLSHVPALIIRAVVEQHEDREEGGGEARGSQYVNSDRVFAQRNIHCIIIVDVLSPLITKKFLQEKAVEATKQEKERKEEKT
jgi:hypothetical protein